jgi:hypothetical protein
VELIVDHSMRINSPLSALSIWQLGGAVARVGAEESAFAGRTAGHAVNITVVTETAEGFEEGVGQGLLVCPRALPHQRVGEDLMDEGEEWIRRAYGAKKYDRLKRKHDTDNFFRLNQSIEP